MIDVEELKSVLEGYKESFENRWEDEKFKWEAVAHFQKYWNMDAPNFGEMFKEATGRTGSLLASNHAYAKAMIENFAKVDDDATRELFRRLFDESQDLGERVEEFFSGVDILCKKYDDGNWNNHYQNLSTVSVYLWLMYPDRYYIYRYKIFNDVAEKLHADYQIKRDGSAASLLAGYQMYDEICRVVSEDAAITDMLQSHLNDSCYPDPEFKILTVDVGFYINKFYNSDPSDEEESQGYWWFCADPKFWRFRDMEVGEEREYTLTNENGRKRRSYKKIVRMKPGDQVIGYDAKPIMKVTALCEITQASDGECIRFKKLESLSKPISSKDLRGYPELEEMEFFGTQTGSLYDLTKEEYDFIVSVIREENPIRPAEVIAPYGKADFLEDVFMTEEKYDALRDRLLYKKNVILQGAPGVGKTFAAKRLAFSIMGEKDESRVEFVQFHQNYSYEDFIMGYRPDGTGFKLTEGIFYRFCQKAENRPDKDYFFIIDEINRGNMSKIFGELLMLIENEYRGTKATLAYSGLPFAVPKNLYIIGMMNTADRSLAMIDYALRRRFSFFEMEPGFDSAGFQKLQSRMSDETFDALIEEIQALNADIAKDPSLGKGFQIGHSYFCLKKDETCSAQWLRSIVDFDILPTLSEYWYDEPDKVSDWEKKLRGVFHDGR